MMECRTNSKLSNYQLLRPNRLMALGSQQRKGQKMPDEEALKLKLALAVDKDGKPLLDPALVRVPCSCPIVGATSKSWGRVEHEDGCQGWVPTPDDWAYIEAALANPDLSLEIWQERAADSPVVYGASCKAGRITYGETIQLAIFRSLTEALGVKE